jgi:hypothetical protein
VAGAETKNSLTILVKKSQTPPLPCELVCSAVNFIINIHEKFEEIYLYVVPTKGLSTVFVGALSTFCAGIRTVCQYSIVRTHNCYEPEVSISNILRRYSNTLWRVSSALRVTHRAVSCVQQTGCRISIPCVNPLRTRLSVLYEDSVRTAQ